MGTAVSSRTVEVGQVLRGLPIALAAWRLPRNVPLETQSEATGLAAPSPSAQEEAVRLGFEEGLRRGREEGLRSGHEEGLRQGRAEAAAETSAARERAIAEAAAPLEAERGRISKLAASMESALVECLEVGEDEMVALCFDTVCRVIGATALQPEALRAHMSHLLSLCKATPPLAVHVHPEDAFLLRRFAISEPIPASAIAWIPDPEVMLGGCIAKSTHGKLDLRLETMLSACKSALLATRAQHRADAVTGAAA